MDETERGALFFVYIANAQPRWSRLFPSCARN